ncbi:hypothetical protein GCM10027048_16110 [Hymenobacter coalescens]
MLTAASLWLATACEPAPDYPDEPSVEFNSIRAQRETPTDGNTAFNRIFVTINYKDGDGDLGLSDFDRSQAPFNTAPYQFNYYVTMFVYNNSTRQFEQHLSFNSFFRRLLADDQKPQPIRGELTFEVNKENGFTVTYPEYRPGNRVKFEIYIYDRALHKSNTITTEELVLP